MRGFNVAARKNAAANSQTGVAQKFARPRECPTSMDYCAPADKAVYRVPAEITVVRNSFVLDYVRTVVVYTGVTEIADEAFRDWGNLAEVVFEPASRLARIGTHAFANTALEKFTAPKSLREIGNGAFMNCKCLREARLNEGLESLGEGVFQDSGLEVVYIPTTLRVLPRQTFSNCWCLRRVEVAEGCRLGLQYCLP